jgi:hypothetical protein
MGLAEMMDELLDADEVAMTPRGNGFIFYNLKGTGAGNGRRVHLEERGAAAI